MASGTEKELHIRESEPASQEADIPRVKPSPKSGRGKIPVPFEYIPSDDGTDENLLVLLHGLGDTHIPFAKLGKQLKLPQTAVLALRAPEQVPFLYEEAYQWYESFDPLGDLLPNPNPTPAIGMLEKVVVYLTTDCKWPLNRVHWFGFAQGGSVAVEFGLWWWKEKQLVAAKQALLPTSSTTETPTLTSAAPLLPATSFGSIITIAGPLLSYPSNLSSPSPTPLFAISRSAPSELAFTPSDLTAFKKGYRIAKEQKYKTANSGMPVGKEEWEPIMKFWSERLGRRVGGGGLYEVLTGFS